jgi:hypothetical protein
VFEVRRKIRIIALRKGYLFIESPSIFIDFMNLLAAIFKPKPRKHKTENKRT